MYQASCHNRPWKADSRQEAIRDLAAARRRQLELARQGQVLASATYAEHAKSITRRLAGCCAAETRDAVGA